MDRWRNRLDTERASKTTNCQPPSSSDYSTCSDNPHGFSTRQKAPQTQLTSEDTLDEIDFSVNILDQNIDTEDNDVFTDCQDSFFSKTQSTTECTQLDRSEFSNPRFDNSIFSETQNTTVYKHSKTMSEFLNPRSNNQNYSKHLNLNRLIEREAKHSRPDQIEGDSSYIDQKLITIMEETEASHRSNSLIIRNSSSNMPMNFKESQVIINPSKGCSKDKTPNGILKKVLFVDVDDSEATEKSKLKKRDKNCSLLGKGRCCIWNTDENSNNHNTTESFILWERLCKSSELMDSRRSKSFSELNSLSESYGGDDELSGSFRTLDDVYLSEYSINFKPDEKQPEKKSFRQRTKSCDSILREVKHLPHVFYAKYDVFLKGLSDEIKNIRKQKVVCTCNASNKHINKENNGQSYKASVPVIKVSSTKGNEKQIDRKKTVLPSKVSPAKIVMNLTKLSPKIFENSSQNKSPKEKSVTPVTGRKLYPWEKEVVSPVAEYIRGKRPSPFKNSPNKKI